MFWYSYRGLQPHLQRAHAGHTQTVGCDGEKPGSYSGGFRADASPSAFGTEIIFNFINSQVIKTMQPHNNPKGSQIKPIIAPIILFVILAFGSVQLKLTRVVGEASLVTLLIASGLAGFIVYFQDRVSKISSTGIELDLAVQKVQDTEASVKDLAAAIVEFIISDSTCNDDPERFGRALAELGRLSK